MNNLHVKKGDTVIIIAGKDKGKSGQISEVDVANKKVVIDGLNLATHFVKPRNAQEKGGIITRSAALDASNVMLVCPDCSKPVRAGVKVENIDGKDVKIRICKKCGKSLEVKKSESKAAAKKATKKTATKKKSAEKVEA